MIVILVEVPFKYMWHNIKLQHPCYGYGIYTTTKHALKGLAECLRFELLSLNIRVTLCCPWFAKTPLLLEGQSILHAIHAILFSSFFMWPDKAGFYALLPNMKYTESIFCSSWEKPTEHWKHPSDKSLRMSGRVLGKQPRDPVLWTTQCEPPCWYKFFKT